ncbi:hypothetical protein BO71DRAFT_428928 [Aspergillus ellipticus CBS 707.79]|uniref:Nicotinamide N-methyltransferase n=1 Tax=Aspergillus ellipticus CBS 707.79 TaxID=1448320 RepID=A0A319DDP4_9EURO|nr:hypothetical protein BO71DRAFT_428928 [Aspergillus ellipticus CBS 707.79]
MLHSRIRPLPRRHQPIARSSSPSAPRPEFADAEETPTRPEDLFGAFLPHLFPDDAPSYHGDPGQHLLYSSPRYGDLEIMVPSYPSQSESRTQEMAAGLLRTDEGVEQADTLDSCGQMTENDDVAMWKVKGERVLELGAGAALPSVSCALAGASVIAVTDHPSSPALSGAIRFNTEHNLRAPKIPTSTEVIIQPHEWGALENDSWAVQNKGSFTRIIAADCYWMRSQHENLVRTMRWFLAPGGRVWAVTCFHTGRAIVTGFFETALQMGFEIERIYERDLHSSREDGGEVRRDWVPVREGEGPENRKRWCVIAVLKKGGEE